MRNQTSLITVVGILLILGGIARIVVALASGNLEHMAFGTIVGIGIAAIGGIALWCDCRTSQLAPARHHVEGDEK